MQKIPNPKIPTLPLIQALITPERNIMPTQFSNISSDSNSSPSDDNLTHNIQIEPAQLNPIRNNLAIATETSVLSKLFPLLIKAINKLFLLVFHKKPSTPATPIDPIPKLTFQPEITQSNPMEIEKIVKPEVAPVQKRKKNILFPAPVLTKPFSNEKFDFSLLPPIPFKPIFIYQKAKINILPLLKVPKISPTQKLLKDFSQTTTTQLHEFSKPKAKSNLEIVKPKPIDIGKLKSNNSPSKKQYRKPVKHRVTFLPTIKESSAEEEFVL